MERNKKYILFFALLILIVTASMSWKARAEEEPDDRKVIRALDDPEQTEYIYHQKPDEEQLQSIFPMEVAGTLEDGTKEWIEVSWKPDRDLKTTDLEHYVFRAVIDETLYALEEVKVPEIKVIIRREGEWRSPRALAKAVTYKLVEKSTKYNNGLLKVGYFVIETKEGRKHAFCAQHQLDSPEVNDIMTESAVYTKATDKSSEVSRRLRKALYYGWGGPADIGTKPDTSGGKGQDKGLANDASHFRRTALAASVANKNSDNTFGYGELFLDYLDKNYPDAPEGFDVHMLDAPRKDNQNLVFYRYNPKGELQLEKTSWNPELSDGNSCYSFKGAEFGVYSKYDSKTNTVSGEIGKLTTDEKGKSNRITVNEGTYYVKELKSPPGFTVSTEIQSVTVSPGNVATVRFSDRPQYAPVQILLKKVGEEDVSLENAEFKVEFYPGVWDAEKNPGTIGKTPLRSWNFVTDEQGIVKYEESYRKGGDALFHNRDDKPVLPLGTVTIQETNPPEGYLINPKVFIVQITPDGEQETVNTYSAPTVEEKALELELVKWQEGTEVPIPGTAFEYTKPDGEKETLVTGNDGKLHVLGLQHGIHTLKEIAAMEGYLLNGNVISFEVDGDNQITLASEVDPEEGEIRVELSEEGKIKVEVEDKVAPFCLELHKTNEKGKKLSGAEFGLYAEKECKNLLQKGVTDEEGWLLLEELNAGESYYLKEVKAPKGYRLLTDAFGNPVIYEIRVESVPAKDMFTLYVNGERYDTSAEGMFSIEGTKAERCIVARIENNSIRKLPEAGSWWMIPIMVAGMLISMASVKRR